MRLLRAILSSPWMVDAATAEASLPLVARLLAGEDVRFHDEERDCRPYAFSASTMKKVRYGSFENAPKGSVAVYPVLGTITKHPQLCGPEGTESLMMRMAAADELENISGHLLEIDSGGGEGTNMETVARFIREDLKKPVVAWFNGTCASAAYYLAAAADEVYASEDTDMVGSIGVLVSFADFRGMWEKRGVKFHDIYASQSELKNLDIKQALEGDYEKIRSEFLDPYADRFIRTIRELRPGLTDDDAYKGQTYMAPRAEEIGMIDGILSYQGAVDRVLALAGDPGDLDEEDDPLEDIFKINNTDMEYQRIQSVLGYALEMQDGGAFLRAEELAKLNRHIVAEGFEAVEADAMQALHTTIDNIGARMDELATAVADLRTAGEGMAARLDEQAAQIQALGDQPGAQPERVFTESDSQPPAGDQLDEFEKKAREAAASGQSVVITK